MSDVNARLVKASDGAAPQQKVRGQQAFEAVEGSDGAQHVKIVDSEGNVQDKISVELPDKQIVTVDNQIQLPTDYPDKAVEARLQAIEQTQSQILDKLNDTIDTRLTGSIVEEDNPLFVKQTGEVIDVVDNNTISGIEAGVWIPLFDDVFINGYNLLKFVFKLYGVSSDRVTARITVTDREGDYAYAAVSGVWFRKDLVRDVNSGSIIFSSLIPETLVGNFLRVEVMHSDEGATMTKTRSLIQLNKG